MKSLTAEEVLQYAKENDVRFVRLTFLDIFGEMKNISVSPAMLREAFSDGVSFDASAVKGFTELIDSDLFLHPDPSTLTAMPWRPQQGGVIRLFCDIKTHDGKIFAGDSRAALKRAAKRLAALGYGCRMGSEIEFYVFHRNESGEPTLEPYDYGGYCDVAPLDRCENLRREIVFHLERMGLSPDSSHHEKGPGQNQINFHFSDAVDAAQNVVSFKSAVKSVMLSSGLFASFMPKPLQDSAGSGLHINLSLYKEGRNLFEERAKEAESFMEGILRRVAEITAFTNPTVFSYDRLGISLAPNAVNWSRQNRTGLIRVPKAVGDRARMVVRNADPSCNPYLVYALILFAGIEGVENGYKLRAENDIGAGDGLPQTLEEAVCLAKGSAFVRAHLEKEMLDCFFRRKEEEIAEWKDGNTDELKLKYFKVL